MKIISFIFLSAATILYSIVFMIYLLFSFLINIFDTIMSNKLKMSDMVDLIVAVVIVGTVIVLLYQPIKNYYREQPLEQYYDNCVKTTSPSSCIDNLRLANL